MSDGAPVEVAPASYQLSARKEIKLSSQHTGRHDSGGVQAAQAGVTGCQLIAVNQLAKLWKGCS